MNQDAGQKGESEGAQGAGGVEQGSSRRREQEEGAGGVTLN